MNLFLIRHGQRQNFNNEDSLLSVIGKKQALLTASWLRQFKIDILLSSPKQRTLETARIISKETGLKIVIDDTFLERVEDKTLSPSRFTLDSFDSNNGKNIQRYLSRLDAKAEKNIVLVTHASTIADFLYVVLDSEVIGKKIPIFIKRGKYSIPECSITIVTIEKHKYFLQTFAQTRHLTKQ